MQKYKKNAKKEPNTLTGIKKCLLLVVFISFSLLSVSQPNLTVSIDQDHPTISHVFKKIEQQTGMRFAYDAAFNTNKRVNLPRGKAQLGYILGLILKESGHTYQIERDQYIVIKKSAPDTISKTVSQTDIQQTSSTTNTASESLVYGVISEAVTGVTLKGATIKLTDSYGNVTNVTTDESGKFSFLDIPSGKFSLNVVQKNYLTKTIEDSLSVDNTAKELKIVLLPGSTFESEKHTNLLTANPLITTDSIPEWLKRGMYAQADKAWQKKKLPTWSIKTNLLSDLTTTINLGAEVRLSDHLTLDVPFSYNEWTFSDNKKFRHMLFQPELRYWVNEPFNNHFIGVHLHVGIYNVGGIDIPFVPELKDSRYEGQLYGLGFSYGYQWILSNRFNLEATIGVGYIYTKYDKYKCSTCGDFDHNGSRHFVGPTKAGLSLIYVIK